MLRVLLRLQTLIVRSQRPLAHKVEVMQTLLMGPSKITPLMRLRAYRIVHHLERTRFGRTQQTLHRKNVTCGRKWTLPRQLSRTRFHSRKSHLRLVTTTTRPQCSQRFIGLEHQMKLLHQFHLRKRGNKQEMAVRVELVLRKGVI
jgi:hypothetical protein